MNPPLGRLVPVRHPRMPSRASSGPLSIRDRSLLAMLLQDSRDCEIAAALHSTEGGIRLAIHRLVRRLRFQNRQDLTRLLFESGIDSLEQRILAQATSADYPHPSLPRVEKAPEFDAFWMFGESAETV